MQCVCSNRRCGRNFIATPVPTPLRNAMLYSALTSLRFAYDALSRTSGATSAGSARNSIPICHRGSKPTAMLPRTHEYVHDDWNGVAVAAVYDRRFADAKDLSAT